jgi:hypothetical protein
MHHSMPDGLEPTFPELRQQRPDGLLDPARLRRIGAKRHLGLRDRREVAGIDDAPLQRARADVEDEDVQ